MSLAGMIRGAIAFGLVLRLDDSLPNKKVIVTTSLSLVCGTVVFFGSFLGFIGDALFKNDGKKQDEVKTGINEELLDGEQKEQFSQASSSEDDNQLDISPSKIQAYKKQSCI